VAPDAGSTRREHDVLAQVQAVAATVPAAMRWQVACGHRKIHRSEAHVRFVAACSGRDEDAVVLEKYGVQVSLSSRVVCVSEPSRKPGFHSMPRHRFLAEAQHNLAQNYGRRLLKRRGASNVCIKIPSQLKAVRH
jgi:hypothetical protein